MNTSIKAILGIACVIGFVSPVLGAPVASTERTLTISTGAPARAPIGWVEFCADNSADCAPQAATRQ